MIAIRDGCLMRAGHFMRLAKVAILNGDKLNAVSLIEQAIEELEAA